MFKQQRGPQGGEAQLGQHLFHEEKELMMTDTRHVNTGWRITQLNLQESVLAACLNGGCII